jgi:hypothetical protein
MAKASQDGGDFYKCRHAPGLIYVVYVSRPLNDRMKSSRGTDKKVTLFYNIEPDRLGDGLLESGAFQFLSGCPQISVHGARRQAKIRGHLARRASPQNVFEALLFARRKRSHHMIMA